MKKFDPSQVDFGHVLVSAGFRVDGDDADGMPTYLREAKLIKAADPDGLVQTLALPISPGAKFTALNGFLSAEGFKKRRGIVMGADTGNPTNKDAAVKALVDSFTAAEAVEMIDVMSLCQMWRPAEGANTVRPGYTAVLEAAVEAFCEALRRCPFTKRLHLEFLIEAEMFDFNRLERALELARRINEEMDEQVTFVCVDLAHLLGGRPQTEWDQIFEVYYKAVEEGLVTYLHVSDPLTRNDIEFGETQERTPLNSFLLAVPNSGIEWIDTEAFNPDDQDLGPLRDLVPQFRGEGGEGWPNIETMRNWWPNRHARFVAWHQLLRKRLATFDA